MQDFVLDPARPCLPAFVNLTLLFEITLMWFLWYLCFDFSPAVKEDCDGDNAVGGRCDQLRPVWHWQCGRALAKGTSQCPPIPLLSHCSAVADSRFCEFAAVERLYRCQSGQNSVSHWCWSPALQNRVVGNRYWLLGTEGYCLRVTSY